MTTIEFMEDMGHLLPLVFVALLYFHVLLKGTALIGTFVDNHVVKITGLRLHPIPRLVIYHTVRLLIWSIGITVAIAAGLYISFVFFKAYY